MNSFLQPLSNLPLLAAALLVCVAAPDSLAANKKNPTSKVFVASLKGEAEIDDGERVHDLSEKSVHSAQGTIIETKPESQNAMVFSNGTGVFVDADTRMVVERFVQEPFSPNRTDIEVEPSISQSRTLVTRGTVGMCTSRMVAGSSMVYATPHASFSLRGNKAVVQTNDNETRISLVEGDVTVRAGEGDSGGQILRAGQQAVIRRPPGQPPTMVIQDIPPAELPAINEQVSIACNARKTVYFDVAEREDLDAAPEPAPVTAFDGAEEGDGAETEDATIDNLVVVQVVPTDPRADLQESPRSLP
jgi:hypothetical protein